MRKFLFSIAMASVAAWMVQSAVPVSANAASAADFYKGKRLKFLIGFGTGGGYNLYSRHVARHMGRHIPGKPRFISQNMPGAGSMRLTNYLAVRAPKDGTVIGMITQAIPLSQLLKYKGFKADINKFNWIGNASVSNGVTSAWYKTPFKTIDDARLVLGIPALGVVPAIFTPRDHRRRLWFRVLAVSSAVFVVGVGVAIYLMVPATQQYLTMGWNEFRTWMERW